MESKCIADTHQARIGESLCGRKIGYPVAAANPNETSRHCTPTIKVLQSTEWCFQDIDHWFNTFKAGDPKAGDICSYCKGVLLDALDRLVFD